MLLGSKSRKRPNTSQSKRRESELLDKLNSSWSKQDYQAVRNYYLSFDKNSKPAGDPLNRYKCAVACTKTGNYNQALRFYKSFSNNEKQIKEIQSEIPQGIIDCYEAYIKALHASYKFHEAKLLYNKIDEQWNKNPDIVLAIADVFFADNQIHTAISKLKLIPNFARIPGAAIRLLKAYRTLDNYAEFNKTYGSLAKNRQETFIVQFELALAYQQQKLYEQADKILSEQFAKQENKGESRKKIGKQFFLLYMEQKKFVDAATAAKSYLNAYPHDMQVQIMLLSIAVREPEFARDLLGHIRSEIVDDLITVDPSTAEGIPIDSFDLESESLYSDYFLKPKEKIEEILAKTNIKDVEYWSLLDVWIHLEPLAAYKDLSSRLIRHANENNNSVSPQVGVKFIDFSLQNYHLIEKSTDNKREFYLRLQNYFKNICQDLKNHGIFSVEYALTKLDALKHKPVQSKELTTGNTLLADFSRLNVKQQPTNNSSVSADMGEEEKAGSVPIINSP